MASINGMQVKEYLQALSDEGKIRVDKIGSGNWYWCFLSEEKKIRDNTRNKLIAEKEKLNMMICDLQGKVNRVTEKHAGSKNGKDECDERHARLSEEVQLLSEELKGYRDRDPEELERKRGDAEKYKRDAEMWTDNVILLESWLDKMIGGDKERMEILRQMFYGDEYVEGEGLRDL